MDYTVTYNAGVNGAISGSESEIVAENDHPASVPIVTPHTGNVFDGWSTDGGTTKLTSAQITVATITADRTYTAYYSGAYYAHINADGFCYSIAQLAGEIAVDATTIKLDTYDESYLGKKRVNGAWIVDPPLVVAQKAKLDELKRYEVEGLKTFISSALGTPHTYLSGQDDMILLNGEYTYVKVNDYDLKPIIWYTKESGNVSHTAAQFVQVYLDGRTNVQTIKYRRATKEAQTNVCTTTAQVDTIGWPNPNPPSVPGGLTGTAGTAQVALNWTTNTDVTMLGGGGYNVYSDGVVTHANTALITGTTFTATGLAAGSHTFQISAVDTDGKESAKCAAITVTVV